MQKDKYKTPAKDIAQMTIAQLNVLRKDWLKAGKDNGDIDACFKVGRELGRYVNINEGHLKPFWRWAHEEIILDYHEIVGNYMPHELKYSKDRYVTVSIGLVKWKRGIMMGDHNNRVLHYSQGDDLTKLSDKNIFVPGDWLDPILAAVLDAEKAFEKRNADNNQREREKLAALLSTG